MALSRFLEIKVDTGDAQKRLSDLAAQLKGLDDGFSKLNKISGSGDSFRLVSSGASKASKSLIDFEGVLSNSERSLLQLSGSFKEADRALLQHDTRVRKLSKSLADGVISQNEYDKAVSDSADASRQGGRSLLSYNGALDNTSRLLTQAGVSGKYSEKVALQYDNAIRALNQALDRGQISQSQYNSALARTQAEMQTAVAEAKKMDGAFRGSFGNASQSAGQLGLQMQDVIVQAQMGTDAAIILAQQGTQIASIFGPTGQIIGTFVAIAAVAGGALYTAFNGVTMSVRELIDEASDLSSVFSVAKDGALELSDTIADLAVQNSVLAQAKLGEAYASSLTIAAGAANSIKSDIEGLTELSGDIFEVNDVENIAEVARIIKQIGVDFGKLPSEGLRLAGTGIDFEQYGDAVSAVRTIGEAFSLIDKETGKASDNAKILASSLGGINLSSSVEELKQYQQNLIGIQNETILTADANDKGAQALLQNIPAWLKLLDAIIVSRQAAEDYQNTQDRLNASLDKFSSGGQRQEIALLTLGDTTGATDVLRDIIDQEEKLEKQLKTNTKISADQFQGILDSNIIQIIKDQVDSLDDVGESYALISQLQKLGIKLTKDQLNSIKKYAESEGLAAVEEKYESILQKQSAELAGIEMSARAKAKQTAEQKILNEAADKGLTSQNESFKTILANVDKVKSGVDAIYDQKFIKASAKIVDNYKNQKDQIGLSVLASKQLAAQEKIIELARKNGVSFSGEGLKIINQQKDAVKKTVAEFEKLKLLQETKTSIQSLEDELSLIGLQGHALIEQEHAIKRRNIEQERGIDLDEKGNAVVDQINKELTSELSLRKQIFDATEKIKEKEEQRKKALEDNKEFDSFYSNFIDDVLKDDDKSVFLRIGEINDAIADGIIDNSSKSMDAIEKLKKEADDITINIFESLASGAQSGDFSSFGKTIGNELGEVIGEGFGETFGNVLSTVLSKSASDLEKAGSAIGATIGATIGGPQGASAGSQIGQTIGSIFTTTKKKIADGFDLDIVSDTIAAAFDTSVIKRSSVFGSSTRTYKKAIEDFTVKQLEEAFGVSTADAAINKIQNSLDVSLSEIKTSANDLGVAIENFSGTVSLKNGTAADAITKSADEYASDLFAALEDYGRLGESASQTFSRLAESARVLTDAFDSLNLSNGQSFSNIQSSLTDSLTNLYASQFNDLETARKAASDEHQKLLDQIGGEYDKRAANIAGIYDDLQRTRKIFLDLTPEWEETLSRLNNAVSEASESFRQTIRESVSSIQGVDIDNASSEFFRLTESYRTQYYSSQENLSKAIQDSMDVFNGFDNIAFGFDSSKEDVISAINGFESEFASKTVDMSKVMSDAQQAFDFGEFDTLDEAVLFKTVEAQEVLNKEYADGLVNLLGAADALSVYNSLLDQQESAAKDVARSWQSVLDAANGLSNVDIALRSLGLDSIDAAPDFISDISVSSFEELEGIADKLDLSASEFSSAIATVSGEIDNNAEKIKNANEKMLSISMDTSNAVNGLSAVDASLNKLGISSDDAETYLGSLTFEKVKSEIERLDISVDEYGEAVSNISSLIDGEIDTRKLLAEELVLQGKAEMALSLQREIELDSLSESEKAIKRRIYDLEDEANALAKLNQAADIISNIAETVDPDAFNQSELDKALNLFDQTSSSVAEFLSELTSDDILSLSENLSISIEDIGESLSVLSNEVVNQNNRIKEAVEKTKEENDSLNNLAYSASVLLDPMLELNSAFESLSGSGLQDNVDSIGSFLNLVASSDASGLRDLAGSFDLDIDEFISSVDTLKDRYSELKQSQDDAADSAASLSKTNSLRLQLLKLQADLSNDAADIELYRNELRKSEIEGLNAEQIALYDQINATENLISIRDEEAEKTKAIADERASLEKQLFDLTATRSESLQSERDALDETNRALFDQVQAAEKAKSVLEERNSLEEELFNLTATKEQQLQKERNSLDESNRSLFDYIQAIKAQQEAVENASTAIDDALSALSESVDREKEYLTQASDDRIAILESELEEISSIAESARDALSGSISSLEKSIEAEREKVKASYDNQAESIADSIDVISDSSEKLEDISKSIRSTIDSVSQAGEALQMERFFAARSTIAGLNTGNVASANIDQILSDISSGSSDFYSDAVSMARDAAITANQLSSLADSIDEQVSDSEKLIISLDKQTERIDSGFEKESEALDAILAEAQKQVDAILGVDNSVLSLSDAMAMFEQTISSLQGVNVAELDDESGFIGEQIENERKSLDNQLAILDGIIESSQKQADEARNIDSSVKSVDASLQLLDKALSAFNESSNDNSGSQINVLKDIDDSVGLLGRRLDIVSNALKIDTPDISIDYDNLSSKAIGGSVFDELPKINSNLAVIKQILEAVAKHSSDTASVLKRFDTQGLPSYRDNEDGSLDVNVLP